jgi:hypothetical protein
MSIVMAMTANRDLAKIYLKLDSYIPNLLISNN